MYPFLNSLNLPEIVTWDDLEKRIISLPTEQARGEAFEEFCHAYFVLHQDLYQTKAVWRWSQTPLSIVQQLGCSSQDSGIDGVLIHYDGSITTYQAKFRTIRSNLPSQHELSTFYMISDRADYRLVISNVDDLPLIARERRDHGQILSDTLLQLGQEFFLSLKEYLQTTEVRREQPLIPKPFQAEAVRAIVEGLSRQARGQAILACGSGKTLIGKWVVDQLKARLVLVLVPSLALVRQTLEEWHRAGTGVFRYICICSDSTITLRSGVDDWELRPSELDVRVSTTTSDLVAFLLNAMGCTNVHVVFSTYQSSPVLVEALEDENLTNFHFDLAIADEAHRLAGVTGRTFAQILTDRLIRSKMRLFMTATPKVVSPRLGSRNHEESDIVYSMNDPNTFGPVLYRFTFGQAIREKIICDYRVVVIGVTEQELANLVRSGGTVQIEDSEIWQAESLAQRVALGKCIGTYGLKKVFTFHNRVQSAARFVDPRLPDSFPAILDRMKPGLNYVALHINGEMNTAARNRILREFRMSPRGVVSNARCLGEGVNVPIVDGVFFADPRESVIDIVQATGRALRRIPGKEFAYLVIPVLVREEEDAEEILEDSKFHTVWKVLSAMVSQDERLEAIIRDTRIRQGEGSMPVLGEDAADLFHEPIDCHAVLMGFPARIPFSKYQTLLTLEVMEKIGERWHLRFGALKKYMETHGEEPVSDTEYEGFKIGSWLSAQRNAYKKRRLPLDREKLLEGLGIQWSRQNKEESWINHLFACREYREAYGKLPNVGDVSADGLNIGNWLTHQRRFFKQGRIPPNRIELFERYLGKVWDPVGDKWEAKFAAYKDYVERTGQQPTRRTVHNGISIGNWLINVIRPKKEKLTAEQIQRFDALGFQWELSRKKVNKRKKRLEIFAPDWLSYYDHYRRLLRSRDEMSYSSNLFWKGKNLQAWFEEQTRLFQQGQLSPDHAMLFERLSKVRDFVEEQSQRTDG